MKMGADDFIATDEDQDWATKHAGTLDLIICTVSSPKMPLAQYLQLLRVDGQFTQVGAPEDQIPGFSAFALIAKGVKVGGSAIGSPEEIRKMLNLFAEKGVKTWNNNVPMKDANRAIVGYGCRQGSISLRVGKREACLGYGLGKVTAMSNLPDSH